MSPQKWPAADATWAALIRGKKTEVIGLFKLTRKTWEESTEWREPITMKPLLGILNRSRRKEMLHCKKNKKVLKWTVHQCPKREKHHINMISSTYIIAGRQELHLVGWRTVAKRNYIKLEEKKKYIILNFTLQCPSSSPSSVSTFTSYIQLGFFSLSDFLKGVKIWNRNKKIPLYLSLLLVSWGPPQHWEKNSGLLTSIKLFYMADSPMWHRLSKKIVTYRVAEPEISMSQKYPN